VFGKGRGRRRRVYHHTTYRLGGRFFGKCRESKSPKFRASLRHKRQQNSPDYSGQYLCMLPPYPSAEKHEGAPCEEVHFVIIK
jgi:hypothetical protein